jgi:hypothetical protein
MAIYMAPEIGKSGCAPVNPVLSGVDSINKNIEISYERQTVGRILF